MATHSLPNRPEEEDGGKMSFFEHLAELRVRLIHACGAIVLGTFIGVSVSKHFLEFVAAPMVKALRAANLQDKLIFTHPAGYLYQIITLGLYLGIVIASPYVLYQIWLFVAPGLYRNERKAVAGFVISSVALFLCGIVFAYYVILPYLLKFLVNFQTGGPFTPLISIDEYFDLVLNVLIGVGVVFELPVLAFLLSLFGIVTPQFLWKNFRYAILIITILAAVITPTPDAITMLVFMAPMVVLYLLSIGVSAAVVRSKRRRSAAIAGQGVT
jgi:sec-independent protein translocase protein TatC